MSEAAQVVRMERSVRERDRKALEFIENVTIKAEEVQSEVLSTILSRNCDTEYLKRYSLNGSSDKEAFRKGLPVITYEDLIPYIQRIANGDTSPILCALPVTEFLRSSGTSQRKQKLLPTKADDTERRNFFYSLLTAVRDKYVEQVGDWKAMRFMFVRAETRTAGGLVHRPAATSLYQSKAFRDAFRCNAYTSPIESILCTDFYESMYSQLLGGLLQRQHVIRMGTLFASGFLMAIRFLEQHWTQLCLDIETGTLTKDIKDPSVREAITKILQANPNLAQVIRSECSSGRWEGIMNRLWPNAKYIDVIVSGTMAQYIPILNYYTGGLPLVSDMYASSECFFGINLEPLCNPHDVSYTLLPNMGYYEFLPLRKGESDERETQELLDLVDDEQKQEQQELVDLVDVKVGQKYELVVTTYTGLYRYRMGDILLVTGFHNKAPQFCFVYKKNVLLSIDFDKTSEAEIQSGVDNCLQNLELIGSKLIDYTSYVDISTTPGHYVLFWELSFSSKTMVEHYKSILEDCCLSVEESLGNSYKRCRIMVKSIGPLEIRVVEEGTFNKLMDYALNRGTSINQYKTPRCIKSISMLEILNSRVSHSYFSVKCPSLVF